MAGPTVNSRPHQEPGHLADLATRSGSPPIVMVPGLDGTALLFYRQQPLLAREFDVVAFPLPDDPDGTMESLVGDLDGLVREVSQNGAILIGESFGGALALSTALRHPDAVRGLVIVNSFPWIDSRIRLWLGPVLLGLLPWAAMPLARRFTQPRLHSRHTSDADLAEFHQRSRQIGRRGYIRRLELLRHYDIRSRLHELAVPTLLLAADHDELLPSLYWGHYMADRIPKADLVVLEGYGHICLISHDLDLLELVGPWWARIQAEEPRAARPDQHQGLK